MHQITKKLIFMLTVLVSVHLVAQEPSSESLLEEGSNILDDPRLQNMFRQVQEDPEKAASNAVREIKANSGKADEAVREATRVFQENQKEIEGAAEALKSNRSAIESSAGSTVSELNRMVSSEKSNGLETPATRPAGSIAIPTSATNGESPAVPRPSVSVNSSPTIQDSNVVPIANAPVTDSQIPDSPFLAPGDFPEPTPLAPKYEADEEGAFESNAQNEVVITSGESEMDNNAGIITFTQNVIVNHPEFILECDKLVVTLADGAVGNSDNNAGTEASESQVGSDTESTTSSFKRAVATGGTVKIRRISPEGTTQIAISRMADYNGITKDIVLSGGPPYIQDGAKHVRCTEPDAQIIMTGDGKYKVNGSDTSAPSRHKISFPVENDGETKTIGIGNSVGGSLDRLR